MVSTDKDDVDVVMKGLTVIIATAERIVGSEMKSFEV